MFWITIEGTDRPSGGGVGHDHGCSWIVDVHSQEVRMSAGARLVTFPFFLGPPPPPRPSSWQDAAHIKNGSSLSKNSLKNPLTDLPRGESPRLLQSLSSGQWGLTSTDLRDITSPYCCTWVVRLNFKDSLFKYIRILCTFMRPSVCRGQEGQVPGSTVTNDSELP